MLWDGYPHESMRLSLKFFMLNQVRGTLDYNYYPYKYSLYLRHCADGLLASLLSRTLLHESQEGKQSQIVSLTTRLVMQLLSPTPPSPQQDKMYDKIVLYTSSLLMIAGAYMMK